MAVGGLFSDLTEDPAHVNVSQYFYSSFLRKIVDHSLPESSVRTIPRCHHVPRRAFVLVSSPVYQFVVVAKAKLKLKLQSYSLTS